MPQEITCRLIATLVAGVVGRLRAQVVEVESFDVGCHCRVRFSREGARVVEVIAQHGRGQALPVQVDQQRGGNDIVTGFACANAHQQFSQLAGDDDPQRLFGLALGNDQVSVQDVVLAHAQGVGGTLAEHAADQARQERITSARRDVYLQLIGELTKASMVLGALPTQQGDELDIQGGFGELLSAAAKAGILGQMDTVIKSRELGLLIQEVLLKMLPNIIKMRWMKRKEEHFSGNHDAEIAKAERLRAEMAGMEPQEPKRIDELKEFVVHYYAEAEKNLLAAENCAGEHFAALQEYQLQIIDETGKIAEKVNELIVCMRSELELETDGDALSEMSRQMRKSSENSIRTLREALAGM